MLERATPFTRDSMLGKNVITVLKLLRLKFQGYSMYENSSVRNWFC